MTWTIEKRKQGNEIWVTSNVKPEAIFIGDGYEKKEYKRSMKLAKVIVEALNEDDKNTNDAAMEAFEIELKKSDSGHQPA
jgi:hypothetical protein